MKRLPIRVRLTAAFAAATLVMLIGAFLFIYLRLQADLDDRVRALLQARTHVVTQQVRGDRLVGVALEDREESFAQLLDRRGRMLDHAGAGDRPAMARRDLRRAATSNRLVEGRVVGVDGRARMLVVRFGPPGAVRYLLVGESLRDRNDALTNVVTSFVVGGPLTVVLASLLGYALARAALAPVERMRRRAAAISELPADGRLPLPLPQDEIHRLGSTLNDMLDRLHESFERESRFVADASHELRTPIAVIKTELEGALLAQPTGADSHDALVAAVDECDRLAQLADDLLVLARTRDGRLPLRREITNIAELLAAVRDRFADRANQHLRVLVVDADPRLRWSVDPERLRQALSNLVDNALRHGQGTITLRARSTDTMLSLAVVDEGGGFPADIGPHAFQRFARGDRSRSSDGAGLGLAIVAALTTAHDGTAAIVAGDGTQTVVNISLPCV